MFEAAGGSYDRLFDHTYAHDGYTSYFIKGNHGHPGGGGGYGPGNNITIQYSYQTHVYDSSTYHAEGCSCSEGLVDFTVRYNYFVDATENGGTACIATASGGDYNSVAAFAHEDRKVGDTTGPAVIVPLALIPIFALMIWGLVATAMSLFVARMFW